MRNLKGFTLIELLVVIAVLGILASVVLVAINPGERINEANDAGKKSDVGQVATALESYFTNHNGVYTGATLGTVAVPGTLVTEGYLKRPPTSTTLTVSASESAVYATLAATSSGPCTSTRYWCYTSNTGLSAFLCKATAPTTACL